MLLSILLCPSALAATSTGWYFFPDARGGRYWQVVADVRYPGANQVFHTGGAATTQVYFDSAHGNNLQAATQAGLASHSYYLSGTTWRYDPYLGGTVTVGNVPRWVSLPSSEGASYSYYQFYSPQSSQVWQWIHWHSDSFWSSAYCRTYAEDQDLSRSIYVTDRNYFQVLQ